MIRDDLSALAGVETLRFKPAAVAILESTDAASPAIGFGAVSHRAVGDRIAVAVSNGTLVYAALLTPAEVETYAHQLLRQAAIAQSEGTA